MGLLVFGLAQIEHARLRIVVREALRADPPLRAALLRPRGAKPACGVFARRVGGEGARLVGHAPLRHPPICMLSSVALLNSRRDIWAR